MFPLTLIFYIGIILFVCQFLNEKFSLTKKNKKEGFSHELEHGPFDEQQQQQYKIPQPSEPINTPIPSQVIQTPSSELNNLYNESGIDLTAKIVNPDVEAEASQQVNERDYEPVASNEVEITTIAPFDQ
tara:strand:- start:128 stop:514 length:387 start_codon:yes stop_codon:yes gene_type:complete